MCYMKSICIRIRFRMKIKLSKHTESTTQSTLLVFGIILGTSIAAMGTIHEKPYQQSLVFARLRSGSLFLLLSSFWATMRTNAMKLLPLDLWHKIWTNWLDLTCVRTPWCYILVMGSCICVSFLSITRSHSILSMCACVIIQPEALRRLHKHDINFYYAHNISLVFFFLFDKNSR